MVVFTEEILRLYRDIYKVSSDGVKAYLKYHITNGLDVDFTTKVVGTTFTEGQKLLKYLKVKAKKEDIILSVIHEKDNQYDPNALRVDVSVTWSDKVYHLGYLSKDIAKLKCGYEDINVRIKDFRILNVGECYGLEIKYYFE